MPNRAADKGPCTPASKSRAQPLGRRYAIWATLLASVLFLAIWPMTSTLNESRAAPEDMSIGGRDYVVLFLCFYWTLGLLITFMLSVLPGIIAGSGNAWAIAALHDREKLSIVRGIALGALIGCFTAAIVSYPGTKLVMGFMIVLPTEETRIFLQLFCSGLAAGTFAGMWHGYKMTRFFI